MKYLITIIGPTAVGKTALSLKLATYFETEIISADSRQFYKEMQIGTAAPSKEELETTKHHFIHHKSITDNYNVGAYEEEALTTLNRLYKNHNVVILVGGSGLFVDAVTKGLDTFPNVDPEIRNTLNEIYKLEGITALQEQLKVLDPITYNNIDLLNPRRIIRALEVCIGTRKPYSSYLYNHKKKRDFKILKIGLTADREVLYHRINTRVDHMIEQGLLEEAKNLAPYQHLNALNTVGYKELFAYFNNECSLEFAISEIKKNSRRFAKRQLTWFRRDESIKWFEYDTELSKITTYLKRICV